MNNIINSALQVGFKAGRVLSTTLDFLHLTFVKTVARKAFDQIQSRFHHQETSYQVAVRKYEFTWLPPSIVDSEEQPEEYFSNGKFYFNQAKNFDLSEKIEFLTKAKTAFQKAGGYPGAKGQLFEVLFALISLSSDSVETEKLLNEASALATTNNDFKLRMAGYYFSKADYTTAFTWAKNVDKEVLREKVGDFFFKLATTLSEGPLKIAALKGAAKRDHMEAKALLAVRDYQDPEASLDTLTQAVACLRASGDSYKPDLTNALYALGKKFVSFGEANKAMLVFREASLSNHVEAKREVGILLLCDNKWGEAISWFESNFPTESDFYLGQARYQMGMQLKNSSPNKAKEYFLRSNTLSADYELGFMALTEREWDKAGALFKHVADSNEVYHVEAALQFIKLCNENLLKNFGRKDALEYMKTILSQDVVLDFGGYEILADMFLDDCQYLETKVRLDKALEDLATKKEQALLRRQGLLDKRTQRDLEREITALDQEIQIVESEKYSLATLFLGVGDLTNAMALFEEGLRKDIYSLHTLIEIFAHQEALYTKLDKDFQKVSGPFVETECNIQFRQQFSRIFTDLKNRKSIEDQSAIRASSVEAPIIASIEVVVEEEKLEQMVAPFDEDDEILSWDLDELEGRSTDSPMDTGDGDIISLDLGVEEILSLNLAELE